MYLGQKFFAHCPSHSNPTVQQIGNYTLANLTIMYMKYTKTCKAHPPVISSPIVAALFVRLFHYCYLY